jgi:hypothetical protein
MPYEAPKHVISRSAKIETRQPLFATSRSLLSRARQTPRLCHHYTPPPPFTMDQMRPSPVQMRVPQGYVQGQPTHSPAPPQSSRGPGPMIRQQGPHPQMSAAQMQQQHQVAIAERELAKRRARKPTDKTIPEGVEEIVPNARVYRELREMERRYDAAIMRKRLDIQDSVNRNVKVCCLLSSLPLPRPSLPAEHIY